MGVNSYAATIFRRLDDLAELWKKEMSERESQSPSLPETRFEVFKHKSEPKSVRNVKSFRKKNFIKKDETALWKISSEERCRNKMLIIFDGLENLTTQWDTFELWLDQWNAKRAGC